MHRLACVSVAQHSPCCVNAPLSAPRAAAPTLMLHMPTRATPWHRASLHAWRMLGIALHSVQGSTGPPNTLHLLLCQQLKGANIQELSGCQVEQLVLAVRCACWVACRGVTQHQLLPQ